MEKNKITSSKKIFFELYTELIQTVNQCELRHSKEFNCYYMVSKKTGIHTIPDNDTFRLTQHWKGFLNNQN